MNNKGEKGLKQYSITYKFLDDPTERIKKQKIKQRKKQQEYRETHRKEISIRQKLKLAEIRKERAKGDKKRWEELTLQEPRIKQIDERTFQNLANKNIGQLYTDGKKWWYEIQFTDDREFYTSEQFSSKNKAINDLRLAI